jgi:hypothetical protein
LYNNASVNDKHGLFNANAHKRTETAFLGVFPSGRYGHTPSQSNTLESAFPLQERAFKRQQASTGTRKRPTGTIYKQKTGIFINNANINNK